MPDALYETDPTAAVALVRSLIPDMEQLPDPSGQDSTESYLFDDVTLVGYLSLNNGSVKRAAADACDALGSSQMLILKKLTTDDLATDGPALAKEYGARAQRLRSAADNDDDRAEDNSAFYLLPYHKRPVQFDPMNRRIW